MSAAVALCVHLSLGILMASMILALYRLIKGPSVPDRVVALDVVAILAVGILSLLSIETNMMAYLTVGITLALLAFLGTVALALYIRRGGPP